MDSQPSSDDRVVVTAVLAGDTDAFAQLVQRYHHPLMHLAMNRLGNAQAAEDAVQEAFIAAYRSLRTYKPQYSFRTWLWTIAINQCRRHGRRNRKTSAVAEGNSPAAMPDRPSADPTPELSTMLGERDHLVAKLMHQLPEAQSDAIRLRFFGQLKYREVAVALGCSVAAAKQRVRAGLIRMSEMLQDSELMDSVFPGDKS